MKTFSALKKPDLSAIEKAQGCLTANLAFPGLGSLAAGRKIGLVQMAFYLCAFALTFVFGLRFVFSALSNWTAFYAEFNDLNSDPLVALSDLWQRTHWALLGILLFIVSWVWALLTSRALLTEAKKGGNVAPPILNEKN